MIYLDPFFEGGGVGVEGTLMRLLSLLQLFKEDISYIFLFLEVSHTSIHFALLLFLFQRMLCSLQTDNALPVNGLAW